MATYRITCANPKCRRTFDAKHRTAKWCKPGCRQSVYQATKSAQKRKDSQLIIVGNDRVQSSALTPEPDLDAHPLVVATKRELEAARQLDSFSGALALQLARKLAGSGDSGVSSLSKELRTVLAAALEGSPTPPAPTPEETEPDEDEDPVEAARRAREQALAGISA